MSIAYIEVFENDAPEPFGYHLPSSHLSITMSPTTGCASIGNSDAYRVRIERVANMTCHVRSYA